MTSAQTYRPERSLGVFIGTVLLGGIMGILDSTMIAAAADTLSTELHTSLSTVSWAATAYLLALMVTIPVTGWAVEQIGGKRLWMLGLLIFLLGSLASGMAWNAASLLLFRVVQGIGAGILDPLVLILLASAAGPARAGRVMGLMGVVLSLGPVAGPVLGGIVTDSMGWRAMFLINIPIGLLAFVLSVRVMSGQQGDQAQARKRLDVLGLILLAPGLAALLLAVTSSASAATFSSPTVLVPLVVGAVLTLAYCRHALRMSADRVPPLVDIRLFARRSFSASVITQGAVGIATFSMLFMLPLLFHQKFGMGAMGAGLTVAPYGLGSALAMPFAGRLSDRIGSRGLVRAGIVLASAAIIAAVVFADHGLGWVVGTTTVVGFALGIVGASTMGGLYRTLPPELVPQGSSVLYMLNQLGGGLGVAVVALIVEKTADIVDGYRATGYWLLGCCAVMAIFSQFIPGPVHQGGRPRGTRGETPEQSLSR